MHNPVVFGYRGTLPTSKRTPLGPYRRPVPKVLGGSYGGGRFLMSEVPLYLLMNAFIPGRLHQSGDRRGGLAPLYLQERSSA